jgi:hypothetical protein
VLLDSRISKLTFSLRNGHKDYILQEGTSVIYFWIPLGRLLNKFEDNGKACQICARNMTVYANDEIFDTSRLRVACH